ncbi:methionine adenosyltransferase domain-containing protein [Ruminococcus sp.]|uniref:methionine adenosyltransferase domain-containing protein n=1 Tax=Ruminococcus sp. TaxID=41978 RepID=UPI0025D95F9E|nr:methionine adenosyltransferase domain-containing protein [Ruminococcus sp.]
MKLFLEDIPDKVCDQISDALLDAFLKQDKHSRCGIETVGGKGKIFVTGEVTSRALVNVTNIVKEALRDVGYDPGMMFGYACRDTVDYIPTAMAILQDLSAFYDRLVKIDDRFLPDGKAQITGFYDENNKLEYIKDFIISYQNKETNRAETDKILTDYCETLCSNYGIAIREFHINPTGKFLIGGFDGDAGLTGRKIVVDNYQSFANVGGGAFSGKDPTKVDRSAAYKARQLAIECLDTLPDVNWCEIQISYAIGMDKPLGIYAKTNKEVIDIPDCFYDECTPKRIIEDLHLIDGTFKFNDTAKFGHFGHSEFPWESR